MHSTAEAAFEHIGLLVNWPPETAEVPFIQSSDVSERSDQGPALVSLYTARMNWKRTFGASLLFMPTSRVGVRAIRIAPALLHLHQDDEVARRE